MKNETITAITGAKDRWRNLPVIVKRLQAQTRNPEKIIVWHDFGKEKTIVDIPEIICINSTTDYWQSFPQFVISWLTNSDYVAVLDDDRPPGPKWFEYLLELERKQPGIYGCFGYRIKDPNNLYNRLELLEIKGVMGRNYSDKPYDDQVYEVDMVGQSYFFPADYIKYFFREKPPTWICVDDLHLAHMCSKFGNVRSFVVFPKDEESRPIYHYNELPHNEFEFAEHQNPHHRINRINYVKWAVENGWKLKFLEERK